MGVTPFLSKFLQEYREKLKKIIKEGQKFIRTALQMVMNASSAAASSVILVITMIWATVSGISKDVQSTIEYRGERTLKLFSSHTDEVCHSHKDSKAKLRSLGICTSAPTTSPINMSPNRGNEPTLKSDSKG